MKGMNKVSQVLTWAFIVQVYGVILGVLAWAAWVTSEWDGLMIMAMTAIASVIFVGALKWLIGLIKEEAGK